MLPTDLSHIDPDLVPILKDLQAQVTGIVVPPVDLTPINAELANHESRISSLEAGVITPPPPPNQPPVWKIVPNITFPQGKTGSFSILPFVSDSDPLQITLNGTLSAGVSFDGTQFIYDGKGPVGVSSGLTLTADDGRP